jgi:hypothetical protein
VVTIPPFQFNPANIRFEPMVKNKYFKGTFSQTKYEYGPFTIYNPIVLIPAQVSAEDWVRTMETTFIAAFVDQMGPVSQSFHTKPISVGLHGAECIGMKISGMWVTDTEYGLNYVWLKK